MAKPTSNSSSFWDHPIEKIEEALHLKRQIDTLQSKLNKMFGSADSTTPAVRRGSSVKKSSKMSAATRAKIAAAQKARWAATRKAAEPSKSSSSPKPVVSKKSGPKKKGGLTPEGRAKLAASMKARWAAKKAGK